MAQDQNSGEITNVIDGFLAGSGSYYDVITNRIRRFVAGHGLNRRVDREEIVSEIIVALYDNLKHGKFRGDSLKALEVYIYSMVKNTVSAHYRNAGRLHYWDSVPERHQVPDTYDSGVTKKDLSEKIMAEMDATCREILDLKFRKFWSDQELADYFGKSKNAMSTAIHRCVRRAQELEIVKSEL